MNGESSNFEERLLKKKEVAEKYSCSERSVDRMVKRGQLTRIKILGGVRFRLSQVQTLMNGGNHDFQS